MIYSAKLIGATQPIDIPAETPEELIAYCARQSSPRQRDTWHEDYQPLLDYCQRNKHWSVFDMADAVIEVTGPRDILRQMLRHSTLKPQEFSQRYSDDIQFTTREVRSQDPANRQNSIDDMSLEDRLNFDADCDDMIFFADKLYQKWRKKGAAKECCRVFLPEGLTLSHAAFKGSIRSWMHYLDVRNDPGVTQWEHVLIARAIMTELDKVFPGIMGARG